MTFKIHILCSFFVSLTVILVQGCSQRAPGDLDPGNIDHILNQAEGRSNRIDMVVSPLSGWRKPNPPVVTAPEVRWIWFAPFRTTWSQYDGQWAYVVVKQFSFGIDDALNRDALPLQSIGTMRNTPDGVMYDRPVIPYFNMGPSVGSRTPWTPGAGQKQVVAPSATVIFDEGGKKSVAENVPLPAPPVQGGLVNEQLLQQSIAEARRRIAEAQAAALQMQQSR